MSSLPEELIERILAHAIPPPRPRWLRSPSASTVRVAPLVVSRQFHRIAVPLLYHSVHLNSPSAASRLLHTLAHRPEYAHHIRQLTVLGIWQPLGDILRLCRGLHSLELTIAYEDGADVDLDVFETLTDMRHLTLRKASNVYLNSAQPRALINSLARAISTWPNLCTANIAFRLSDDTPMSPSMSFNPFFPALPAPQPMTSGPITSLATALAGSPALHTFSTQLPSVWNVSIASIAANPALERICLYPASCAEPQSHTHTHASASAPAPAPAIPGTGLFLMEARRHPRLAELIAAGTPIIRSRAHTLGTHVPLASPSASASITPAPALTPAPAPAPAPALTAQPKPYIGLGLRIDTSAEAINNTPEASAEASASVSVSASPLPLVSRRFRSPVVSSPRAFNYKNINYSNNNNANANVNNINPAWMGTGRTPSSAGVGAKAKGRRF